MTLHIEWSTAKMPAGLIDEEEARDFSDGHGIQIEPGNVGLHIGGSDGAVVEGSREELAAWLLAALALVEPTGRKILLTDDARHIITLCQSVAAEEIEDITNPEGRIDAAVELAERTEVFAERVIKILEGPG